MKRVTKISSLLILMIMSSCYKAEVFSDIPQIDIVDVVFFDTPPSQGSDSLVISFNFQDGSGDIGLNADDDIFFPFNQFLVFLDSSNTLVTVDNIETLTAPIYIAELITNNVTFEYRNEELFYSLEGSGNAIPAFNKQLYEGDISKIELECPNLFNQDGDPYGIVPLVIYDIENGSLTSEQFLLNETLLVQKIETHNNLIIEFYEKISGEYLKIDFDEKFNTDRCNELGFDGRLPLFDINGKSGKISYKVLSSRLKGVFQDNQIMMKLFVYDRMLNKSNVDSIEFFLSDITQ